MNKSIFWFIIFLSAAIRVQATPALQPANLSCEYLENPLGIDIMKPRLSWNFISTRRNQLQSAYEIIVSDNQENIQRAKGNVWKTGKINSPQSINIEYNGSALQSFTKYYWRIKVYNAQGEESGWSAVASFETAMLQTGDPAAIGWKAKWIDDGTRQFEKDEDFYKDDAMPLFRKQFSITKKIASARLYISGLGYYEAYMNNTKISNNMLDPGFTSYRKQALYATHDITPFLKKGNNNIGIMLGNGWWNALPLRLFGRFNFREVQQTGRPCVKAELHIRYADGTNEIIATDESWQTATGPVVRNNVYLGELYDARLEKNFSSIDGWKNVVLAQGPSGMLTAQMQPPIRITKVVKPIIIKEVGKDTFIVDMGQNFAGVARIRVKGAAGSKISLRYGEDIFKDGRLNYLTSVAGQIKEIWNVRGGPGAPKTAWQKDEYITKGEGTETWSPRFTFHGFRYVEITGWPGTPSVNDIEGLRMNSDISPNGSFSCSYNIFNRLHEAIRWTFLSNIFSVQSDCPAREKMGYGADIVVTAEAYIYNYNMLHFYRKTVKDYINDQQPDGGITEIAPYTGIADRGYGGESGPLGWQLAFPFLQKKLYDYYGDKKIIEECYEPFKKQMEFLQAKALQGLYYWDISDHEALDPKPEAFTASAFYYHHAILAAEFAAILNKKEDEIKYTALAKKIRSAIVGKFWVTGTGRFDNATQSAQLFALWYQFTPDKKASLETLMNEFSRHKNHVSTGIFSTKMLFDVLRENDLQEKAFELAAQKDFPGWGYMLGSGATTLWETWAYPDNAPSQNHPMFGSIDEWFYKSILGINAAAPGFEKIIIKPQALKELTWAKGTYKSVRGIISGDWKKEADKFLLKVSIPANTTAEIWLTAKENELITDNGKSISEIEEVKLLRYENGYAVIAVGSGDYTFSVDGNKIAVTK
ncbi:MAG: family 78 glycoside hydrolase catalytic domain [Chitinophagaceae bacterium]